MNFPLKLDEPERLFRACKLPQHEALSEDVLRLA